MPSCISIIVLLLSAIPSLTKACNFEGSGSSTNQIVSEKALCLPQGASTWTFGMTVSLSATGLPGDDFHGGATFYIMDHTCKVQAAYDQPSCGIPYVARENFLKHVLSVTTLSADVGSPYFSFNYGDGKYSIRNNGCVCGDMKSSWNGGMSNSVVNSFPFWKVFMSGRSFWEPIRDVGTSRTFSIIEFWLLKRSIGFQLYQKGVCDSADSLNSQSGM